MLQVFQKPRDQVESVSRTADALQIETARGTLRLEPQSSQIVRIRYAQLHVLRDPENPRRITGTEKHTFADTKGIGIVYNDGFADWSFTETEQEVLLTTSAVRLSISKSDAAITYEKPDGTLLLKERAVDPRDMEPFTAYRLDADGQAVVEEVETADGVKRVVRDAAKVADGELYHTRLHLEFQQDEHVYGLGQAEEGVLDLRGTTQYVHQANRKIAVPFFLSTKGYGLLSATGSTAIFEDTQYGTYLYTEADPEMDYYFLQGDSFDAVIRGYRTLTGAAAMLPAWAFGYAQSQERYETQEEMLQVMQEYRKRGLGLDLLVLDWQSWEGLLWGQKTFDKSRFPDLQGLTDALHDGHVRMMVSIWPNMSEDCDNYREFKEAKMLLPADVIYDAFRQDARELYWKQTEEGIFQYGVDAWWCDSSEPYTPEWSHRERPEAARQYEEFVNAASIHMGAARTNAYGLVHAQGIYEGQRGTGTSKRVVNLTRNGYTGQQRYGTILWSGDTEASWTTFRKQIPAGLNFCASGLPYWTLDIGAFFVKRGMNWYWTGDYNDGMEDKGYQELYTRWFQYGAFLPIFRAHGTDVRREMWAVTEPAFYEALVATNRLRYKLLPYIYSLAGHVWKDGDTILRMLAFDFPQDETACRIKDQFLFGPSLMVCPVTEPMYYEKDSTPIDRPKTRKVYLPEGCDWTCFYTGKTYAGGAWITVDAPIDRIPLFVKAGSIIPMAEPAEYAEQALAGPIHLAVYPGKDAVLDYYEDEQDGYGYETGRYSIRHITWNEAEQKLTVEDPVSPAGWQPEAHEFIVEVK